MNHTAIKQLFPVNSDEFRTYGRVLEGYKWDGLQTLLAKTEAPADRVDYVASCRTFEAGADFPVLRNGVFGGIPCQAGYCNGYRTQVGTLEYHCCSELILLGSDAVLPLGHRWDIESGRYDFGKLRAFYAPSGTAVELYATTLHFSPCAARPGASFRAVIILPRTTNSEYAYAPSGVPETQLLAAKNKWVVSSNEPVDILPLITGR